MKLKVVFFASIREALGEGEFLLDEPMEDEHLSALVARLVARYGKDARDAIAAGNVRVAVNQQLIDGDVLLKSGDEVAFFPPVTGG